MVKQRILLLVTSCWLGCGVATLNVQTDGGGNHVEDTDTGKTHQDAGVGDAGKDVPKRDAGIPDAGRIDGGQPDAGVRDAGTADSGVPDPGPLPYPTRTAYRLKGIQPDSWAKKEDIANNNTGGVLMNLIWTTWEGAVKALPCSAQEQEFQGHCFTIDKPVDDAIADWTKRGLVVSASVYGVPTWAQVSNCSPAAGYEIFCAPNNAADYGRFVGMLAQRYDGKHGHGRIADFIIHKEANTNAFFDVGCGQGTSCSADSWIQMYADSFNAAYDAILTQQPHAKVFIPLSNNFGTKLNALSANNPVLSGETFLMGVTSRIGTRAFRVNIHPYQAFVTGVMFSSNDWPLITLGNIGTLAGWLRHNFPNTPSAWEVHISESGLNSTLPYSSETAQANALCTVFHNILGTPGIENYLYQRMVDQPVDIVADLHWGLRFDTGERKQAWDIWAMVNRNDLSPPQLSCGFEDLPYVRLTRHAYSKWHWTTTRQALDGYVAEASWRLLREPVPGSTLLYECDLDEHNLVTTSADCEGHHLLGPLGYSMNAPVTGFNLVELFRCRVGSGSDHFVSSSPTCEGKVVEGSLGWVLP